MRSLLFVPGDSDRKLAKATSFGADCLLLDLEDAVALPRKAAARHMVAEYVRALRGEAKRPRLYVRINALDTPEWEHDIAAVVPAGPDGILLPKPRDAEDVGNFAVALDHAEAKAKMTVGDTRIVALAGESPLAVLTLPTYLAGSSARLAGLTWGAEDLAAGLGASATREAGHWTAPFMMARNMCLYTAHAAGLEPYDTVFPNFRDLAGLAEECRMAARDGFAGKAAIHPDQVAVINAAFTPATADIAWADAVVAAFRADPGAGAMSLDGKMIDKAHVVKAERILKRAAR